MKARLFDLLLVVLISGTTLSQTQTQTDEQQAKSPTTKIGSFLAKKGRVVVKDFYTVGTVYGRYGTSVELSGLVIYEPGQEAQRIRGLKIQVKGGGRIESENSSFLDFDEAESFAKAISYLTSTLTTWKTVDKEYTEITFSTKDNFSLGFYQKGRGQTCFSESGNVGKSTCFFEDVDLATLQQMADKAVAILKQK
jgi:hypothetical protein